MSHVAMPSLRPNTEVKKVKDDIFYSYLLLLILFVFSS
ncbi:hypothetical protein PSTU1396_06060 [Providencia stuartii]|nr:hypothetical protein PSTU1396_06060 [Providencia stuartii]